MNIFYLSSDLTEAAHYHFDTHAVKMPLEYQQIMSTIHHVLDPNMDEEKRIRLYKPTHQNHPSTKWAMACKENYVMLHDLCVEVLKEYTSRYGKIHKSQREGLTDLLKTPPEALLTGKWTEPTPAMPEELIVPNDSVASYKNHYVSKKHLWKWKHGNVPEFILASMSAN